jgi:transcriptional regulator with XRE-family HTH domain
MNQIYTKNYEFAINILNKLPTRNFLFALVYCAPVINLVYFLYNIYFKISIVANIIGGVKMKVGYGEFINRHRIASGFTKQVQLAEKTGITAATISRIEKEIQKPSMETLKELARYLSSTSYVELMVVCGYWDEDDLLEEPSLPYVREMDGPYEVKQKKPSLGEDDFIANIDLSDEELLKRFNFQIDGMNLTKNETKGIIAYVRSLRHVNQNKA